jgi:hypothetical protein
MTRNIYVILVLTTFLRFQIMGPKNRLTRDSGWPMYQAACLGMVVRGPWNDPHREIS